MHTTSKERMVLHIPAINYCLKSGVSILHFVVNYVESVTQQYESRTVLQKVRLQSKQPL